MPNLSNKITPILANSLARSYSALLYPKKLRELLEAVVPGSNYSAFDKYSLHLEVNRLLCGNYRGEELIKYQIAKRYLLKDTVAAFEIRVGESRADFASINGVSRCYEIKTALDNLDKLDKQSLDYTSVFEYNTIILDEKHLSRAERDLPSGYGIMVIGKNALKQHRKALKNDKICSLCQLEMLTAKELTLFFGGKRDDLESISLETKPAMINKKFKLALKKRYQDKWNFVREHHGQILPIDFQFFFSTQEQPSLLYQKNF